MATFSVDGLDDLALSLSEISEIPEDIQDEILNAQADILIPQIQERGRGYGVERSGMTLRSIKKGKAKKGKNGRVLVVAPRGRNKKKVSYSEIAFLNNYGSRKQSARPFFTDAVAVSEQTMHKAAERVYDRWLKSKNL